MHSHTIFLKTKQTVEHKHKIKCRTSVVVIICIGNKYNLEHDSIISGTPK